MSIPYRTRRVLNRVGITLAVLLLALVVGWLCWVIWLQRYVVYTDGGAALNFQVSANEISGDIAKAPEAAKNVSIYYNEGDDAIDIGNEMKQLNGYYIDSEMLQKDLTGVLVRIEQLPAGTPILIDMKGPYGSFFYPSKLPAAVHSASTDIQKVSELVSTLQKKGFYTIARVCAFRDWNFGNNNVPSGLYMLSRAGLWLDPDGYFWLDPTNANTTSWITDVVLELRDMGFNEVLLTDFRFPNSDKYIFNGDKVAALQTAAATLVSSCAASDFVLSFGVDDPAFALPQGRCRMYLSGITANGIGQTAAKVTVEDPTTQLAFIAETGDTRYDAYSVLRSLYISDVVEAQKKAAEQQ